MVEIGALLVGEARLLEVEVGVLLVGEVIAGG